MTNEYIRGAAGVGTACWTGVFLRDVINHYARGLKDDCKFICFEGCDKTAKVNGISFSVFASDHGYVGCIWYIVSGKPCHV